MSNRTVNPKTLAHLTVDCRDRMAALDTLISEAQQTHERIVLMAAELHRQLKTMSSLTARDDGVQS
ncbi:hypothetical protein D3C77_802160 [compost metagenome]